MFVDSEAAQAAQEAAARINRQLGLNPSDPSMQPPKPGPMAGLGLVTTENYQVPDKMVGLSEYECFCSCVFLCRKGNGVQICFRWFIIDWKKHGI